MGLIPITPATGMKGTEGKIDYLKIAEADGYQLGIKAMVAADIENAKLLVAWRLRVASEGDAKDARKAGTVWPTLPMKKVDTKRASGVIHLIVALDVYDSSKEIVEEIASCGMMKKLMKDHISPCPGLLYPAEQIQAHMVAAVDTGITSAYNEYLGTTTTNSTLQQAVAEKATQSILDKLMAGGQQPKDDPPAADGEEPAA